MLTRNIVITQLENFTLTASDAILSVYNSRLLAGRKGDRKLFVYSADNGTYMHAINLPFQYSGNTVYDAVWIHSGNIVYTTRGSRVNTVEVTTVNGILTSSTTLSNPRYLSASANGIIYLAEAMYGVYQSVDNGRTWN